MEESGLYIAESRRKCLSYQRFLFGDNAVLPTQVHDAGVCAPPEGAELGVEIILACAGDDQRHQRINTAENQQHNRTEMESAIQNRHS